MMSRETERDLAAMVKVEKRAKETARAERDDLRRQLAEMQTALENLTPGGSEFFGSPAVCLAWIRIRLATAGHVAAERNDLRRQLEATQAELAAVRIACEAYKTLAMLCTECGGTGQIEIGDFEAWRTGDVIKVTCPMCQGTGKAYNDPQPPSASA